MKRQRKLVLALVFVLALICAFGFGSLALESGDFSYEITEGGSGVRITGYKGDSGSVVIPDILEGRAVTEIGAGAFSSNSVITEVTISSNVVRIQNNAFENCENLKSVVIPASVGAIGQSAFGGCSALESLSISSAATTIGYYSFENCSSLKSVTIPSSKILSGAFRGCKALETINLLDSVQSIGKDAFKDTAWEAAQAPGLLILGKVLYKYTGEEDLVKVPEGATSIADYAFYGLSLSRVVLPAGIYYIGANSFDECPNMNYVSVPSSVIAIGTKAFGYVGGEPKEGFTVYCHEGGIASEWAKNNSFKTEFIDSCEHSFSDWTVIVEPACESEGQRERSCIKCNYSETETLAALGHDFSGYVTVQELTCTQDGIERRTCTRCSKTEDKTTPAPGHKWDTVSVVKEPNCTEEGEEIRTCSVCGATENHKTDPLGHKWIVDDTTDQDGFIVTKEPNCTEKGEKQRTCSVCGVTAVEEIDALGHRADEWTITKDPTPISPGERQGVCVVCGETFTEEIPPVSEPLPDDAEFLTFTPDAEIEFDESKNYVYNIGPGKRVSEVLEQFDYPGHIVVTDFDMNEYATNSVVGTGVCFFLARLNETTGKYDPIDSACAIVRGDVNGDGLITAADARLALRTSANLETLKTPYLLAADTDKSSKIDASDARSILRASGSLEELDQRF